MTARGKPFCDNPALEQHVLRALPGPVAVCLHTVETFIDSKPPVPIAPAKNVAVLTEHARLVNAIDNHGDDIPGASTGFV